MRSHPDLRPITSWCQFPPPAASEFSRVAWVRGLPSASHFARVSQGAAGAAAWFQTRHTPPRGSRPRALRAFFSNVDRRGGEKSRPRRRAPEARSDERDRARARSARRGGPSSAVVAAPTATDGAVDLSVHPSGIVPQLQCVRPLSALVPTDRILSFFLPSVRATFRTLRLTSTRVSPSGTSWRRSTSTASST